MQANGRQPATEVHGESRSGMEQACQVRTTKEYSGVGSGQSSPTRAEKSQACDY